MKEQRSKSWLGENFAISMVVCVKAKALWDKIVEKKLHISEIYD